MVTIRDVAEHAGVSVSTVSHAISGKRPISQVTRQRIFQAIEQLGYEPNPAARALRTKSTGVIGFFAFDITEVFAARIIHGVERIVREKNCFLLFTSGVGFNYDLAQGIDFLRKRRVDGIIIAYGVRQEISPKTFDLSNIPLVTINTFVDLTIPSLHPDDFQGGKEAALHLVSKQARHPAMIAGPENRLASKERLLGFQKGLEECGMPFDASEMVMYGDFGAESGSYCFDALLKACPDLDAVFCANDYMAAGAINRAITSGISIPQDMHIIGYDDREFAAFWPIPITTFAQPLEYMGELGATMLFERIDGHNPEPSMIKLAPTLIARQSS